MDGSHSNDKNKQYISSKKMSKCFGTSKRSYNLNFIRELNRASGEKLIDNSNLKMIKAPKFSSKAYEKATKSSKADSNKDGNFKFVFQSDAQSKVNANIAKSKFKFSGKRNSMAPSISGLQISLENTGNNDE